MMTSRTHTQHDVKQQPRIGVRIAWCSGLGLSITNNFVGKFGKETPIDSGYIE
jgi:hypothetical protein